MVGAVVYNNQSQRCQTDCYRTRSHYRKTWFFLGAGRVMGRASRECKPIWSGIFTGTKWNEWLDCA